MSQKNTMRGLPPEITTGKRLEIGIQIVGGEVWKEGDGTTNRKKKTKDSTELIREGGIQERLGTKGTQQYPRAGKGGKGGVSGSLGGPSGGESGGGL